MSEWCIVIGASAGGVETLKEVVSQLPADFPAPIFVVLHIPPYVASMLPSILSNAGPLKAIHPKDGEKIQQGVIYVAPPDHHLLIHKNTVAVKKGPKENRFRPSIDALFRSAAYTYGTASIGVVLSGALDDGTSGLWNINRLGGIAIVQIPDQARFKAMPRSALEHVKVDHQASSLEMGALICRLIAKPPAHDESNLEDIKKRFATENHIAAEGGAYQKGIMNIGGLTPYACPACHGVLIGVQRG